MVSEGEFDADTGSMGSADSDSDGRVSGAELSNYQATYGGSGNESTLRSEDDGVVSERESDASTATMASADTNSHQMGSGSMFSTDPAS